MKHKIGDLGVYDEDRAELTLLGTVWDESEVDNMLRVLEYSPMPLEDLAELFTDANEGLAAYAYKLAQTIEGNSKLLAELVYGEIR